MSKFYVMSGDLKTVIDRATPGEAIRSAFQKLTSMDPKPELSMFSIVSESGFDSVEPSDLAFLTETILEEVGLKSDFLWVENDED